MIPALREEFNRNYTPEKYRELLAALAVVSLMTVVAGWLPARRAAKVNPVTALRCE